MSKPSGAMPIIGKAKDRVAEADVTNGPLDPSTKAPRGKGRAHSLQRWMRSRLPSMPRNWRQASVFAVCASLGLASVMQLAAGRPLLAIGLTVPCVPLVLCTSAQARRHVGFTPEMEQCAQQINAILQMLDQRMQEHYRDSAPKSLPPHRLIVSLLLLRAAQQEWPMPAPPAAPHSPKTADPDALRGFCKEARHFMRHAAAVYGAALCLAQGLVEVPPATIPGSVRQADRGYIATHCGLREEDLAVVNMYHNRVLSPNHYLAVDHAARAVVLAICGTTKVTDVLTDLVATATPFLDGDCMAHEGIAAGASNVLQVIGPDLHRLLQEHPGYRLVVTGHSLGGGTAVLLTYLLLHRRRTRHADNVVPEDCLVQCFAYAPPPVLSAPQLRGFEAEDAEEVVSIFVNKKDLVPALSLGNAYRLSHAVARLDRLPLTQAQRATLARSGGLHTVPGALDTLGRDGYRAVAPGPESPDAPASAGDADRAEVVVQVEAGAPALYHAGQVWHVQDDGAVLAVARAHNAEAFQEIQMTASLDLAIDHLPVCYEQAMDAWHGSMTA